MAQADPVLQGDIVDRDRLSVPKAKALVRLLISGINPFARLVECWQSDASETVVIDVEVELPQKKQVYDIRRFERLAIVFDPKDETMPEVLALRADFPLVPHLNLRPVEFPRSLCLHDQPYQELKLRWTAAALVERIRSWLALTAKGCLHGDDQPLEPLLLEAAPDLVLPSDLLSPERLQDPQPLTVRRVEGGVAGMSFIAERREMSKKGEKGGPAFVATTIVCEPHLHGIISRTPRTLLDLHDFVAVSGTDLLGVIRARLKDWKQRWGSVFRENIQDAFLILIMVLPKIRRSGGAVEATEIRAFVSSDSIQRIGEEIGIWKVAGESIGLLLVADMGKDGAQLQISLLNPRFALSRSAAAYLNGHDVADRTKIAAIGAGALGSQVIMNLARAGFGEWTLIDQDKLLPHNLARHSLQGFAVGFPKVHALAHVVRQTIDDGMVTQAFVADVLRPGNQAEQLRQALQASDVILDMSASIAVARHLVRDLTASARRISLFLNPSGTCIAVLAEDKSRQIPLDMLEMQLYRELASNPDLAGYFGRDEDRVRHGQSCRDMTNRIPQDLVALHAAIGSRAVRRATQTDEATISVWRANEPDFTVAAYPAIPGAVRCEQIGAWTLQTDVRLLTKLEGLRSTKLPKETGGVLIGSFDLERRIIYLVDTVPSPPDSEEWPTLYIRGCEGLTRRVQQFEQATDGMLQYVGEWHAHPDGCGIAPSPDDLLVLGWLAEHADAGGFPALMLIVGERGQVRPLLGGMLVDREE